MIGVDSRPFDLEGNHALDIARDQPPPAPTLVSVGRDDPDPPFNPKALWVALLVLAGFWLVLGTAIAVLWL
jgi:MYXO-CTERM domain-containing protein